MKTLLLLLGIALSGLLAQSIFKPAPFQTTTAEVIQIERVRNTRKGGNPFVYEIHLRYTNRMKHTQHNHFVSKRLPTYQTGEIIPICYRANRVWLDRDALTTTKKQQKTYL